MYKPTKSLVLLLTLVVKSVLSANILYVAPTPSGSHHIWNKALILGLLTKGHNVTMLTHETEKNTLYSNFAMITMEGIYNLLYSKTFTIEEFATQNPISVILKMYEFVKFCCQYDYNTSGFQFLLDYPQDYKFDLIIFDNSLGTHCHYPLIERFNSPPVLVVSPFQFPVVLWSIFGSHLYTSYNPYSNTQYTNQMNLLERTVNIALTYYEIFYRKYSYMPREATLIKAKFGHHKIPLEEIEKNISLLLCNIDPVLEYPLALPPNVIPVGGLHARPADRLPKDLQKILDEAKHGAILFSLGSNLRSDRLALTTRKILIETFAKLPQTIIWKFETDDIEGLPHNVIIRKWLPQNDMLGHLKLKLFISHCGALSVQEALYHGVPVLAIPFYLDQYTNARRLEKRKIAKKLDWKNLTTENLYETINELLKSDIYRKNMQAISRKYKDQPQSALERGVFWVEYLLRHGTVEHLVLPISEMSAYQVYNLDVLAVYMFVLMLMYLFVLLCIISCKFVFSYRKHTKSKML